MRMIIDRFEGDYAVCETESGEIKNISKSQISKDAKEGDILIRGESEWQIDADESKKRRMSIENRLNKLFIK